MGATPRCQFECRSGPRPATPRCEIRFGASPTVPASDGWSRRGRRSYGANNRSRSAPWARPPDVNSNVGAGPGPRQSPDPPAEFPGNPLLARQSKQPTSRPVGQTRFGGIMNYARALLPILLIASPALADGPFTMQFEELSPGVWAGVRPDAPRSPVMGNTTFVISDEGVVVFDGGGVPAMSDLVIDKIRSLTDLPVTHVITSHWHGDHNFGIYRFAEEYENVQFIAHQFTRDVFESERIHYIDRSRNVVSNNLAEFRKIVETGVDSEGEEYDDAERAIYRRLIDDGELIDRESVRSRVTPRISSSTISTRSSRASAASNCCTWATAIRQAISSCGCRRKDSWRAAISWSCRHRTHSTCHRGRGPKPCAG